MPVVLQFPSISQVETELTKFHQGSNICFNPTVLLY